MTTTTTTTELLSVPLAKLTLSQTAAQKERRAHMDKAALDDLVASVKIHGVIQPILVRTLNGGFEIVAGERRFLAAKKVGLEEIQATRRDLTDDQVQELQLVENLQREGLHEMAEAEGYQALMKLGNTVEDIAAKVGKSKATVYARLKLLALAPDARKAFYSGEIQASIALLLARIPTPALQKEALKAVTDENRFKEPMSYREAAEHIQRNYMLRLADAPFDSTDAKLVEKAGACGACPFNTLAQPDLFPDVKSGKEGVCTNPTCFQSKCDAHDVQTLAKAKEAGQKILSGEDAKKVFPYGPHSSAQGGYTALDDSVFVDNKSVEVRKLVGKDVKPVIVKVTNGHGPDGKAQLKEVIPAAELAAILKEKGVKVDADRRSNRGSNKEETNRRKKAKQETAFRFALYAKIRAELPGKLEREDLELIASELIGHRFDSLTAKKLYDLWTDWPTPKVETYQLSSLIEKQIPKLSDKDLVKLLFDAIFVGELTAQAWSDEKPERLQAAARRFKVSESEVRKELQSAQAQKLRRPPVAGVKKARRGVSKKK